MSKAKSLLCKICAWQVVLEEQDTEERQSLSLQKMINLYYGGKMSLLIMSLFLAFKKKSPQNKRPQQTSQFVGFCVFHKKHLSLVHALELISSILSFPVLPMLSSELAVLCQNT